MLVGAKGAGQLRTQLDSHRGLYCGDFWRAFDQISIQKRPGCARGTAVNNCVAFARRISRSFNFQYGRVADHRAAFPLRRARAAYKVVSPSHGERWGSPLTDRGVGPGYSRRCK